MPFYCMSGARTSVRDPAASAVLADSPVMNPLGGAHDYQRSNEQGKVYCDSFHVTPEVEEYAPVFRLPCALTHPSETSPISQTGGGPVW
jgi:hypothetical protein